MSVISDELDFINLGDQRLNKRAKKIIGVRRGSMKVEFADFHA